MIKHTRVHYRNNPHGKKHVVLFARGNLLENIYLWFRGFRPHDTIGGWWMIKYPRNLRLEKK